MKTKTTLLMRFAKPSMSQKQPSTATSRPKLTPDISISSHLLVNSAKTRLCFVRREFETVLLIDLYAEVTASDFEKLSLIYWAFFETRRKGEKPSTSVVYKIWHGGTTGHNPRYSGE